MYSREIEFSNHKEEIIKAPLGKHVIAKINEDTNKSEIVGEFDSWLEAHTKVDELNKNREDEDVYAVYNDKGAKTRDHRDVDPGKYPPREK